eukprot:s2427_g5.t1
MLGKTEAQDTFVVFSGSGVMLSKSIPRIQTDWKSRLGFYIHFNAPTWQFQAGFGGRVRQNVQCSLRSTSFRTNSTIHASKAQKELKEEIETQAMGHEDPLSKRGDILTGEPDGSTVQQQVTEQPCSSAGVLTGPLAASGDEEIDMTWLNDELSADDGQHVPVTSSSSSDAPSFSKSLPNNPCS